MIACVRWLLLVVGAKAQLILPLVERPYLLQPPLEARAFRLDSTKWALFIHIDLSEWMDYAFDSLLKVQMRLYGEEGRLIAETLLALPEAPKWQGPISWQLPPALANQWTYIEAFPETIPEKAFYARCYFPGHFVRAYPLQTGPWLSEPITLMDTAGRTHQLKVGDSLWQYFFEPARVDTAWPLLPYILTGYKPRWASTPCAWYLKGDSSQVFWTCALSTPPPKKLNLNPTRQAEARQRFSHTKPGDRTDFGLIYASWGPPDLRLYTTNMETWVYTKQKLSFVFERQGQDWVLQRRLEYQAVWK
jgi:hypothetical protein